MKKLNFWPGLIMIIAFLINSNCTKNPILIKPVTSAGKNLTVLLPDSFVVLSGVVKTPVAIKSYNWEKISGPSSFIIENKDSLQTTISNLVVGEYQFELTVIDENDLSDIDTVTVWVDDISSFQHQELFRDKAWGCPLGCSIDVGYITFSVPPSFGFKILLFEKGRWEMVAPGRNYDYSLYTNNRLVIWPGYEYESRGYFNWWDTVDIKIIY